MNLQRNKWVKSSIAIFAITLSSCEDFVNVSPPNDQLATPTVYTDNVTATAALLNVYAGLMAESWCIGSGGLTIFPGLSADELINESTSTDWDQFYSNSLNEKNSDLEKKIWTNGYQQIYAANSVIEGLTRSAELSSDLKTTLLGEAKFMRAFIHFYLTNLFGDIPLVTTTDYRINSKIPRTSQSEIYSQIIKDLIDSENLLGTEYLDAENSSTHERVRPNKYVVQAFLARVFLYQKDWSKAEDYATKVININPLYTLEKNPDNVFLKESTEAIWQLKPSNPVISTYEGSNFILDTTPSYASLQKDLVNQFNQEDERKKWVDSIKVGTTTYYYPTKYKTKQTSTAYEHTEYYMMIRLAEIYFIRSEARAQLNNLIGSQEDLNIIRTRANLSPISNSEQETILEYIQIERRIELFTELGHRWFDLKRWNMANSVIAEKSKNWSPTDALYPIPYIQIQNDPSVKQNPGY